MADEKAKVAVLYGEIRSAHGGAAVYSNRFIVNPSPAGLRIGFLENDGTGSEPHFRSAVLLAYQDAIELRNLLSETLKPVEEQILAAHAAARPPNNG